MKDNDNELDPKPETLQAAFEIPEAPEVAANINLKPIDVTSSQESTRARIALLFTQVFLIIVILALIGPFILNLADPSSMRDPVDTAKNLVTLIASVLAGPFGFIVGFYYKQGNQ